MNMFDLLNTDILNTIDEVCNQISSLPIEDRIELLNQIKLKLHKVGPFCNEPVDCVLWEKSENVDKNNYNPNAVAPPEMALLKLSIRKNHYTQPIVTWQTDNNLEIIDGEHRSRVGKECKDIATRIYNHLPVVIVNQESTNENDRIAATIRHNRARGVHNVMSMTDIVLTMLQNNWTDEDVAKELGMDADEFLRFKQNTGIAALFKNVEYSKSWE